MKRTKQTVILTLAATLCVVPALPQVAVIDVSAIAKAVEEIKTLSDQYNQMINEYNLITNQYNQMLANAKGWGRLGQFKAPYTNWKSPTAASRYGTSAGWVSALVSGFNAAAGYTAATVPLSNYDWASISPDAQADDQLKYSTIELTDGLAQNSMTTVGNLRANASNAAGAIAELEANADEGDQDPSEVQALQTIGSGTVIALHNQQDANQLLASLVETQTLAQKAQRDAMASSIHNEIAFSSNVAAHFDALFSPDMQQGVDNIGLIP